MRVGRILAWIAGIVLIGLYGYATAAAVGNLMGMSAFLGAALGPLPWTLLGVAIGVPALALVISLFLARGRGAGVRILLLATGLCVTAAIHLEIMHLIS